MSYDALMIIVDPENLNPIAHASKLFKKDSHENVEREVRKAIAEIGGNEDDVKAAVEDIENCGDGIWICGNRYFIVAL